MIDFGKSVPAEYAKRSEVKFSKGVLAFAVAAGCIVAYVKSEKVQKTVDDVLSIARANFPKVVKQHRESSNLPR